ncbi:cellulose biosynthesis protein BcsF [Enterobacteriaceae bacterium BIT-l23]|jgi:cellulose biosynthesis operon protein BcsF/YhjT|uniref:cellulose biosynthesis protein BcsF n=1 Tax=Jejubacter sp. L23 TaxID=3092086 RepID=UPI001584DB12|nr:cellulose biosynthesis protein BcsF [Enterobacteriaceae bacterium BIT-l23]
MMTISDILQLIALCAVIFLPLGFYARRWLTPLAAWMRITFFKPRFVKPAGTLRRQQAVRANSEHD